MRRFFRIVFYILTLSAALSCSTTRTLQDGEYRLAKNRIEVVNDKDFNTGSLNAYVKQKPTGWSPFIYVYNWMNGKGKG
jgi:hypothetical protein